MATIEANHDGNAWKLYVNGIETGDTYESQDDALAPYTYAVWIKTENGDGHFVGDIIASDDDAARDALHDHVMRQIPPIQSAAYSLIDPNGDPLPPRGQ